MFVELLKAEDHECPTLYLEDVLNATNVLGKSSYSPIKDLVSKLRRELNSIGVPCNTGKSEDPNKIIIKNKRNSKWGQEGYNGFYCIIVPREKNKLEKLIADLFWRRYEYLSAQKEGQNKVLEINAKLGDVYQIPLMQEEGKDCEWSINNTDEYNQNILIEAPNGYGKTTLVKSILLSSIYEYRDDLSQEEVDRYLEIRKFHKISEEYLCLFITYSGSGVKKYEKVISGIICWMR